MPLSPPELPSIDAPDPDASLAELVTLDAGGARGQAVASIDLGAEAVRGGPVPELVLRHGTSGAANGVFGVGWALAVPAIRRGGAASVPRFRDDGDEPDPIVHDALGMLVPELRRDGERWLPVVRIDGEHEVRRYAPRTDADGTRAERWRHRVSGLDHWVVLTPDGVRHTFGRDAAACVSAAPAPDGTRSREITAWLLQESRDDRGNLVAYDYRREDGAGVVAGSPEHRRTRPWEPALHPARVQWGNRTPGAFEDGACFEVVVDYGDRAVVPAGPDATTGTWPVRDDPFSTHRGGLEVRTRRLARRLLVFHRDPADAAAPPVLARAVELTYDERPDGARLVGVARRGWRTDGDRAGVALPPTTLEYSETGAPGPVRRLDDDAACGGAPSTLTGQQRWIDLDGTGLPGLLSYDGGTLRYKENLGDGRFGAPRALASTPAALGPANALDRPFGDGRACVMDASGSPAFQARAGGEWSPRTPFARAPSALPTAASVLHADLNGDGRDDLLIGGDQAASWQRFDGERGWATAESQAVSTEVGTALLDATGETQLADMTGDGLADLVRVRPGSVAYWPSLGHGRFGARVDLAGAPALDGPEAFDPGRVRLVDVDGVGGADLLYLGRDGITLHRNQSGNGLAPAERVAGLPTATDQATIQIVDLLGTGTACLLFSGRGPAGEAAGLRFVELAGGRQPHLLTGVRSHGGAVASIEYAPSTRFMREDARDGTPWVTTIPAVVALVSAVVQFDGPTGVEQRTTWRYRHGVYDRSARELRGFGLIERRDRFRYPDAVANPRAPQEPERLQRTWYDGGALDARAALAAARTSESWSGDPAPIAAGGLALELDELATAAARDAHAALEGAVVREEIFGLADDPADLVPHRVTAHGWSVDVLQPGVGQHRPVAVARTRETLTLRYDGGSTQARATHALVLSHDRRTGQPLRTVDVGYGATASAGVELLPAQRATTVVATTTTVAHVDEPTAFRLGVPIGERVEELLGARPPRSGGRYTAPELAALLDDPSLVEVAPGATGGPGRRLLEASEARYWDDARSAARPAGQTGPRALLHSIRQAVFTPSLVTAAYGGRVDDALLTATGYVLDGGVWWDPGDVVRHAGPFLTPVEVGRAGGPVHRVELDAAGVHVTAEHAPDGGTRRAEYDVIARQPRRIVDPTGVTHTARFDETGRVGALATATPGGPSDSLDAPSWTWDRDETAWVARGEPRSTRSAQRIEPGVAASAHARQRRFVDGADRTILRKELAEAGPAAVRDAAGALRTDAAGQLVVAEVPERWIAHDRVVPRGDGPERARLVASFTADDRFEPLADAVRLAPWSTTVVDALGRERWAESADGSLHRTRHPSAWRRELWNANDCSQDSAWTTARRGPGATTRDAESVAQAQAQAATPSVEHVDAEGRVVASDEDDASGTPLRTALSFDGAGNALATTDARGLVAQRTLFDLRGEEIEIASADAGTSRVLRAAAGGVVREWTPRGLERRIDLDAAGRRTHRWTRPAGGPWRLVERTVHGDEAPPATPGAALLHGQPWITLDAAGATVITRRDGAGRTLATERRPLRDLAAVVDWSDLASTPADGLLAAAEARLAAPLRESSTYDARGLATVQVHPDGTTQQLSRTVRGSLARVVVDLPGGGAPVVALESAAHDAAGAPLRLTHGNGVVEVHAVDAASGRLTRMTTTRPGGGVIRDQVISYDAVGNPLRVTDAAAPVQFFGNAAVTADLVYRYDAVDRLVEAEGRESAATADPAADAALLRLPGPADPTAVRRYTERYTYDRAGNLTRLAHAAGAGSFSRTFEIDDASNRVVATPDVAASAFAYDPAGNPTRLGLLDGLRWDADERLDGADLGGGGQLFFRTDASGSRVARVAVRNGGSREERVHVGAWDRHVRRSSSGAVQTEATTLLVGDPSSPVAVLELRNGAGAPPVTWRHQHREPFGSVRLESDDGGRLLTFEEFRPYGTAAYRAAADVGQPLKRHRFGARERDEDLGLDLAGARYYVAWLGRWATPDPAGMMDGANRYWFVRANPIRYDDPTGHQSVASGPAVIPPMEGVPNGPHVKYMRVEQENDQGKIVGEKWAWSDAQGGRHVVTRIVTTPNAVGELKPPPTVMVQRKDFGPVKPITPGDGGKAPSKPSGPATPSTPAAPKAAPTPAPPAATTAPPPPVPPAPSSPSSSSTDATGDPLDLSPNEARIHPSPAPTAPPAPAEDRSWWSRGGGTLVTAGIMVGGALLFLALASNPVGWAVFAAGMALGAGTVGLGLGAHQLATSDERTAKQDEELNQRYGVALAMGGSPVGLAGGLGGALVGGEKGMMYGAYGGAAVEGVYGITKGGIAGYRYVTMWRAARLAESVAPLSEAAPLVSEVLPLEQNASRAVSGLDHAPPRVPPAAGDAAGAVPGARRPAVPPEVDEAVELAFREFEPGAQAAQNAVRGVAPRLARGNFGERMAADALARDGHQILSYKPDINGTNQGGIDIVSMKDGIVYFVDNKALTRAGNVSSVSAMTTNLAQNTAAVIGELNAALRAAESAEEVRIITAALNAIEQGNVRLLVTNGNVANDARLLTGVTQNLRDQHIDFLDIMGPPPTPPTPPPVPVP